jgi:alkylation response protein AidB-like acyl-CoA dehydrogenase
LFNSAAPDDGNMMVLEALGTPEQKARWLAPIVSGMKWAASSAPVMYHLRPEIRHEPSGWRSARVLIIPDDGNMMVLEALGTPEQKARWLAPIVSGEVRSAFAMTEQPGWSRWNRKAVSP